MHQAVDVLPHQLDAWTRQGQEEDFWDMVVVDNASTDATAELARRYAAIHPRTRVVVAVDRVLCAHVGVQEARGAAIAFVDADHVVSPSWSVPCTKHFAGTSSSLDHSSTSG